MKKKDLLNVKVQLCFAALNTKGETIIKAKKSRDHSELLFKYLKLPIKIIKKKNMILLKLKEKKNTCFKL